MKKIIAFSLWGNDKKYTIGAIKNAKLLHSIYPNWTARFYCGASVPADIIYELEKYNNTEIVKMKEKGDWNGMFWRFYPASEKNVDILLSRDTDSRINVREKEAVDEWIKSDKDFHIMRDHPEHTTQILGGMWGVRGAILKDMKEMIDNFTKFDKWQIDQDFLREKIYPLIRHTSFVHDEFLTYETWRKCFPHKRDGQQFVGETFTFDDRPNLLHRARLG